MIPYYQCKDCSFRGKSFPQGRCPACASHNVIKPFKEQPKKRANNRLSLLVCVGLWTWLLYQFGVISQL